MNEVEATVAHRHAGNLPLARFCYRSGPFLLVLSTGLPVLCGPPPGAKVGLSQLIVSDLHCPLLCVTVAGVSVGSHGTSPQPPTPTCPAITLSCPSHQGRQHCLMALPFPLSVWQSVRFTFRQQNFSGSELYCSQGPAASDRI